MVVNSQRKNLSKRRNDPSASHHTTSTIRPSSGPTRHGISHGFRAHRFGQSLRSASIGKINERKEERPRFIVLSRMLSSNLYTLHYGHLDLVLIVSTNRQSVPNQATYVFLIGQVNRYDGFAQDRCLDADAGSRHDNKRRYRDRNRMSRLILREANERRNPTSTRLNSCFFKCEVIITQYIIPRLELL
jgi:hypothetical protein